MQFKTNRYSLEDLGNTQFIIPSYQRPYVWGQEQIEKLLDDFFTAYQRSDSNYFVGTVITSKQGLYEELIDGQQRFTTLWLIAVAFKLQKVENKIQEFLEVNNHLRLNFAIRNQLKEYLTLLMKDLDKVHQKFPDDVVEQDEYLVNIAKGIKTIDGKLNTFSYSDLCSKNGFANFIYKQVLFVKNTAPKNTDLNKLFTTINNSGLQLEQTDIVKSNLLRHVDTEKIYYSKIWEACENMNNFFERNVREIFKATNFDKLNSSAHFKHSNKNLFLLENQDEKENEKYAPTSLQNILFEAASNQPFQTQNKNQNKDDSFIDDEIVYCEPIIDFGQLLLHTYRIFLKDHNLPDFEQPFHTKNLIQIFKNLENLGLNNSLKSKEEWIKDFFDLLWTVRYNFDLHVIKWLENPDDNEKQLSLTNIYFSNGRLSRSKIIEKSSSLMLQSVLYFTSNYNTQIWLTPFLKRLIDGEEASSCLEIIDNELSLSTLSNKETSYLLIDKASIPTRKDLVKYLEEPHGTSFKHYWFQKLEYILWKHWVNKEDGKFKSYRITSKNSVEHIYPQNPEFGNSLEPSISNDFGNLALLSVSQNSSYRHQSLVKKSDDFNNKGSYDSLKLYEVYKKHDLRNWNKEAIEAHRSDMINRIVGHYTTTTFFNSPHNV